MTSSKCPRNFLPIQHFSPLKSMTSFQTQMPNDMILSHFFADSSKTRSYMSNLMISKFYQKSSQNRFKMKTHSHIISDRHKPIPISGTRDEKIDLRNFARCQFFCKVIPLNLRKICSRSVFDLRAPYLHKKRKLICLIRKVGC